MGLLSAIVVGAAGGLVVMTGGLGLGLVAPILGFTSGGVAAGSLAAGAMSYTGNVAAGSVIAKLTSMAMLAPTP